MIDDILRVDRRDVDDVFGVNIFDVVDDLVLLLFVLCWSLVLHPNRRIGSRGPSGEI